MNAILFNIGDRSAFFYTFIYHIKFQEGRCIPFNPAPLGLALNPCSKKIEQLLGWAFFSLLHNLQKNISNENKVLFFPSCFNSNYILIHNAARNRHESGRLLGYTEDQWQLMQMFQSMRLLYTQGEHSKVWN